MDRNTLVQQVQLSILERYDVLLDCSKIDDSTLSKLSKRLPKANGQHTTFASWCDHVLGDIRPRPAVARFAPPVPGQTQIAKLRLGLRERLSRREKDLTTQVRQLQKQVDALHEERSAARIAATPTVDFERERWVQDWQYFYAMPRGRLLRLLDEVQDIEGPHREYQGEPNSTYRRDIAAMVQDLLAQLVQMGFGVDVTLVTHEKLGTPSQTIPYFQTSDLQDYSTTRLSFNVEKMPTDILHNPPSPISGKSTCHVALYCRYPEVATDEDIEHLGAFLHRLFAALAKSANYVPRGGLRENLMLGLMLSFSAPGIDPRGSSYGSGLCAEATWEGSQRQGERPSVEVSPGEVFRLFTKALTHSS